MGFNQSDIEVWDDQSLFNEEVRSASYDEEDVLVIVGPPFDQIFDDTLTYYLKRLNVQGELLDSTTLFKYSGIFNDVFDPRIQDHVWRDGHLYFVLEIDDELVNATLMGEEVDLSMPGTYVISVDLQNEELDWIFHTSLEDELVRVMATDEKIYLGASFSPRMILNNSDTLESGISCSNCDAIGLIAIDMQGNLEWARSYGSGVNGGITLSSFRQGDQGFLASGSLFQGSYTFGDTEINAIGDPFFLVLDLETGVKGVKHIEIQGQTAIGRDVVNCSNGKFIFASTYQGIATFTENGEILPASTASEVNRFISLYDENYNLVATDFILGPGDKRILELSLNEDQLALAGSYNCRVSLGDFTLESSCEFSSATHLFVSVADVSELCQMSLSTSGLGGSIAYELFPNPAQVNGQVTIDLKKECSSCYFSVSYSSGEKLRNQPAVLGQNVLELPAIAGPFFVSLFDGSHNLLFTEKVLVH